MPIHRRRARAAPFITAYRDIYLLASILQALARLIFGLSDEAVGWLLRHKLRTHFLRTVAVLNYWQRSRPPTAAAFDAGPQEQISLQNRPPPRQPPRGGVDCWKARNATASSRRV